MNTPKVGQRVRVVLEGDVTRNPGDGCFELGGGLTRGGYEIISGEPHVVSVEVIAKPLKVGDVIEGEQYESAPTGTVVKRDDGYLMRLLNGDWSCTETPHNRYDLKSTGTVVYLPEATP